MKRNNGLNTPFSNLEISAFCGQIALILKSGISSIEGISIMLEDAEDEADKAFLKTIQNHLLETGSFYTALEETGLFPAYMLRMVDIGEQTGTTDDVMEHLSRHYAREHSISQSLRNAITYPLIMSGMMIVVIIVLLVKVMPIFNQVFVQLGTEMTGFSKALMNIGNAINHYSILFIVFWAILILFGLFVTKTTSGKQLVYSLSSKFALLRSLYANTAACRFASGMALTLSSGLTTEQCVRLSASLIDDSVFTAKINSCLQQLEDGKDVYEAIHNTGIFSGVYARMASLGARTGTMDKVMDDIASLYQDEVDTRINNLLSILEPTLVIILSLFVGIILLSVMLPLIGIMSGI